MKAALDGGIDMETVWNENNPALREPTGGLIARCC
jgi:hypothetical protein